MACVVVIGVHADANILQGMLSSHATLPHAAGQQHFTVRCVVQILWAGFTRLCCPSSSVAVPNSQQQGAQQLEQQQQREAAAQTAATYAKG